MRSLWTRHALERLAEIEEFIALDAPERAAEFAHELMDQVDRLEHHPDLGRSVPEDAENLRRELIHQGYRIIYRVDANQIYVLSVFEGSRLVRPEDLK